MLDVDDTEVDTLMNTFNATMTETARTFEIGGQNTARNCATVYTKVTERYWMSNQDIGNYPILQEKAEAGIWDNIGS